MKITRTLVGFGTFRPSVKLYFVRKYWTLLIDAHLPSGNHAVWEIRFH